MATKITLENISIYLVIVIFILTPVDCISNKTFGLSNYFKACHLSSPDLGECIKENVLSLRPRLAKGMPEIDIPKCEPIVVPSLEFNQGRGPIAVRSFYKDVNIWGATDFSIQSVDIDVQQNTAKIQMNFPRLYLEAIYELEGKILMLPINGSGFSKANYTNIDATLFMEFDKKQKDGDTYVQCKDVMVELEIGGVHVHLDNLFNGNKELGKSANKFLNKSSSSLAEEVKPALELMVAGLFKELTNKLCEQQPIDKVFPK